MKTFFALLMVAVFGIAGCSGGGSGGSNISSSKVLSSIAVQPAHNRMAVGTNVQFKAIGMYSDNSSKEITDSVKWSSSDTSVAAISSTGMVTALASGTTTITAASGGISGTTTLTVAQTQLVSVAITPPQATIAAKTTLRYTATGFYSDNTTQDLTASVTWTSSATSVATVQNGLATAVAPGQATITATSGGIAGTAALNVTSATLQNLAISPAAPTITTGLSQQFVATGTFSDNSTQDLTAQTVWNSSAAAVASIDANGKATAVAAGTATITGTCNLGTPVSASTVLTVTSGTLRSIAVTPANPTIAAGTTLQLTATGSYSDGSTRDLTTSAVWSSSATAVVKNPLNGKATADTAGETTITATMGAISGSTLVTVTAAPLPGTWTGAYTIYDDALMPEEIGKTYPLKFVLAQNGSTVTGTAEIRGITSGPFAGTVSGRNIQFSFPYFSPVFSTNEEDVGTAVITDNTLTGNVLENHVGGYNLSYSFVLTKQP